MQSPDPVAEQEEIEFWHSVLELQHAMFSKCLWIPGLSEHALNRMVHDDWCSWCRNQVSDRLRWPWEQSGAGPDPNQLELELT